MNLLSPLAPVVASLVLGCSAFPDVTYADETEEVSADDDGALGVLPGEPTSSPEDSGVDASEAPGPGSEPPPSSPPDAGPGPGPACTKDKCVGTACTAPGTCDRCKDACKGQTKKCCANVDPVVSGGLALSCIADHALCPGESP